MNQIHRVKTMERSRKASKYDAGANGSNTNFPQFPQLIILLIISLFVLGCNSQPQTTTPDQDISSGGCGVSTSQSDAYKNCELIDDVQQCKAVGGF